MRQIIFTLLMLPSISFAQQQPQESTVQDEKNSVPLVRAVDDRRQLIRQKRDLLDLDERPNPQVESQTISD